jgi:hypothetical protein
MTKSIRWKGLKFLQHINFYSRLGYLAFLADAGSARAQKIRLRMIYFNLTI